MEKIITLGAAAICALTISGVAQASTMINLVGTRGGNPDYVFGVATCAIGCQGVLDGSISSTTAYAANIGNSSEANEVANLNLLLNPTGTFVTADATKVNNGTSPFTFSGLYIAIKTGNVTSYLFNSAGVEQSVSFSGNPAGGLSHKTNIGTVTPGPNPGPSPVPLPATGLLLLGAAGGLTALRRRRKA